MRKIVGVMAAAAALAGCSAESLRSRPPEFVAVYDVPWERMANCLQLHFIGAEVTPLMNQRDKTATIVVAHRGIIAPGPLAAEYRVRSVDNDDKSEVQMRRYPAYMSADYGRKVADDCAKEKP